MKIEVRITDDAGNVQQYVVSGSLPDNVMNSLKMEELEWTDENPLFAPVFNGDDELITGEYVLVLGIRDKRQ